MTGRSRLQGDREDEQGSSEIDGFISKHGEMEKKLISFG